MEVGKTYIEVAQRHFTDRPETLGATGTYKRTEPRWTLSRVVGVFFCVYSWKARNIVLPSGSYDYIRGSNLDEEQEVEWLYGGNMIVRRAVFEKGFEFNEEFTRWSFGEDAMFSYQVHKAFPGSLRYLPDLAVSHLEGREHKMPSAETLRMKVIYRFIFWRKEVWRGSFVRTLAYIWSQVGMFGLDLLKHPTLETFRALVESYHYLLTNWRGIAKGSTDYNSFIFAKGT